MNTTTCDQCGHEIEAGEWPFCPHGRPEFGSHGVVGDEIDIWVKHGLCHDDGSPRHFRSRKEMFAVAKEKGMVNMIRTATTPGPDRHRKVFGMRGHTKGSTQT